MERLLRDIAEVSGVSGTFVAGADGTILASTMPDSFDAGALTDLARTFNRTFEALRVSRRRRLSDFDLTFENGRLVVKNLGEGALVILCTPATNVPLLNLTANVVSHKVQELLKESAPAAPTAMAAAAQPPEGPSVPTRGDMQATALAVLNAARERKIVLRVMGEVAVQMRCPSAAALLPALSAETTILEIAARGAQAPQLKSMMASQGWEEERRFNALYGTQRLRFVHPPSSTCLEIFLDNLIAFHRLEFGGRLHLEERTLPLADLLLAELQDVKVEDMGLRRICALLMDHELGGSGQPDSLEADRVVSVCAEDWGWYKTATMNLEKASREAARFLKGSDTERFAGRARRLLQMVEDAPKSRRWQARARVGESRRWYEIPE